MANQSRDLEAVEERLQSLLRALRAFGFAVAANTDPALCLGPILPQYHALIEAHDAAVGDLPALVEEVCMRDLILQAIWNGYYCSECGNDVPGACQDCQQQGCYVFKLVTNRRGQAAIPAGEFPVWQPTPTKKEQ